MLKTSLTLITGNSQTKSIYWLLKIYIPMQSHFAVADRYLEMKDAEDYIANFDFQSRCQSRASSI